jgi:hypothetical protein
MATITKAQHARIIAAVAELNAVRLEIQTKIPAVNWYLEDSDNLNLMSGDSHNDKGTPQHQNVIQLYKLDRASGGGW